MTRPADHAGQSDTSCPRRWRSRSSASRTATRARATSARTRAGRTTRSGGRCGTPARRSPPAGSGRGRRGGRTRAAPTAPAGRRRAFPRRGTARRRAARDPGRASCAAASPAAATRRALLEPEHLRTRPERPAERRDDRRALQPAAARRRRDQVPEAVGDVEVDGAAARLAGADGGLDRVERREAADPGR